eukprot:gene13139-13240_t
MPDNRRLLKLAYIYGANASGKTTILKAFDFLRELFLKPLVNKSRPLEYDPFLFNHETAGHSTAMELSFYCDGVRYVYEISFDQQRIIFERLSHFQSAKPSRVFARETHSDNRVSYIQFGNTIKVPAREKDLLESNTLHNNTVFGAFAKTNVNIPELEKLNRWFSSFLMPLVTAQDQLSEQTAHIMANSPEASSWIIELLHKADPQVSGVEIGEFETIIDRMSKDMMDQAKYRAEQGVASASDRQINSGSFMPGFSLERKIDFIHQIGLNNSYKIPLRKESSGTQRYFGLAGLFYQLVHGEHLLCIDELETSLHPDLMRFFLQFEKDESGAVNVFSAADFDSSVLRKDASISTAYRTGRLGAKPNLGSPYIIGDGQTERIYFADVRDTDRPDNLAIFPDYPRKIGSYGGVLERSITLKADYDIVYALIDMDKIIQDNQLAEYGRAKTLAEGRGYCTPVESSQTDTWLFKGAKISSFQALDAMIRIFSTLGLKSLNFLNGILNVKLIYDEYLEKKNTTFELMVIAPLALSASKMESDILEILALRLDNEFIRIANDTGFTNEYAESVNEVTAKQQANWLGLIEGISYQDVLAVFLNRLFNNDTAKLPELLTPAICGTKGQLNNIVAAWNEVSKDYYKKVTVLKSILTSRATGGDGNEEYFQVIRKDLLAHPMLKTYVPDYVQKSKRRFFIKDTFESLINAALELNGHVPHETHVNEVVQTVNEQYISETWNKALQRMQDDPEAAITSARNKLGDAHGKSKTKVKPSARHAALAVNLAGAMCSFLLQTYDQIQEIKPETK